jgi:hypothetical protein
MKAAPVNSASQWQQPGAIQPFSSRRLQRAVKPRSHQQLARTQVVPLVKAATVKSSASQRQQRSAV